MHDDAYWKDDPVGRGRFAGFERGEVSSTYVNQTDRFVVSLVISYSEAEGVQSAAEAAWRALELTRDAGSSDTQWYVYDRKTGQTTCLEQEEFEGEGWRDKEAEA